MKKYVAVTFAILASAVVWSGSAVNAEQAAAAGSASPTFNKDIAPIFYANCTSCHRPGEIAPMSLITYKDARPWAKSIATKVADGTMPPWHADPKHGTFVGARVLTDAQKSTIAKWVGAGAPEGSAADLPAAPVYSDGWNIETDVVLVDAGGLPDSCHRRNSLPVPRSARELRRGSLHLRLGIPAGRSSCRASHAAVLEGAEGSGRGADEAPAGDDAAAHVRTEARAPTRRGRSRRSSLPAVSRSPRARAADGRCRPSSARSSARTIGRARSA